MAKLEDTKFKILQAASALFSAKGFAGTSMRDIAREADVNLASINYHFKNKERLYWTIAIEAKKALACGLEEVGAKDLPLEPFIIEAYRCMSSESTFMKNLFKMMLSDDQIAIDESAWEDMNESGEIGPPGAEVIAMVLIRHLGEDYPKKGIQWGVHTLFTHIAHWALMINTTFIRGARQVSRDPTLTNEFVEFSIRHHAQSVLEYLKNHRDIWEQK